jgi:hypothetical protein
VNPSIQNALPYMNQLRQVLPGRNIFGAGLGFGAALGAYYWQNDGASGYLFAARQYSEGPAPGRLAVGGSIPLRVGRRALMVPRTPYGSIAVGAARKLAGVAIVEITDRGSLYTTATATFTASGTGDTALGIPIISGGTIVGVVIQNPGSYLITPTPAVVTCTIAGDGSGATCAVRLAAGGWNQAYPPRRGPAPPPIT